MLSTQERSKKNLFLTVKGKNNDGADYIPKALKKGASFIISSRIIKNFKNKTVKVKNVIKFLNDFALKKELILQQKLSRLQVARAKHH